MSGASAYVHTREWALWTWRFARRALALLGAFLLAVMGAAVGVFAAMTARQPDAVLLQIARETNALPPSATHERDMFLFVFALGIALAMLGLYRVRAWFGIAPSKESN